MMKPSLSLFLAVSFFTYSELSLAKSDLNSLFQTQLKLRSQVTAANAAKMKNKISTLRYREDMAGEATEHFVRNKLSDSSRDAFTGEVLLNPKFQSLEFQSGDVLLIRGKSTVSATIAGVTETPSQFSHLALVYIDLKGKKFVIEALIEGGTIVHDLNDVLTEGVPRMVVFRHQDASVAHAAASYAFAKAQSFIEAGKTIPYDFKFNMNDYSELYCAELIRMAYDMATQAEMKIPLFPSVFGPKLQHTLKSLQVENLNNSILFAPSDIDVDTRFDLVAEWRDFQSTLNFRIKDQILITLLKWVEAGGSKVNYASIIELAKQSSQLQASSQQGPSSVDPGKIKALLETIDKSMNDITGFVLAENDLFLAKHGRNMNEIEIRSTLEKNKNNPKLQQILIEAGLFK